MRSAAADHGVRDTRIDIERMPVPSVSQRYALDSSTDAASAPKTEVVHRMCFTY